MSDNLKRRGVVRTSSDVHAPTSDTAAVLTYAASTVGQRHVIDGVQWSYNATPTGGSIIITNAGTTVFSVSVTAAGPGFFPFDPPLTGSENSALVITLAAGGSNVTGKINAAHRAE